MPDTSRVLSGLANSPAILREFLQSVPKELLKERRLLNKWSIHEHACHLTKVEEMITRRLAVFIQEDRPEFVPYVPGKNVPVGDLIEMDLSQALDDYNRLREANLARFSSFEEAVWNKQARHPEYKEYTPFIMARHVLFHDHFHMLRMEELWLTKTM